MIATYGCSLSLPNKIVIVPLLKEMTLYVMLIQSGSS
jgi:hypothetical protein